MALTVKLITESVSGITILNESEGKDKSLYIEGIFSSADIENKNGRKYKGSTLKREVEKLQPLIKENKLYGELSHPERSMVEPERYAIMIKELKIIDEGKNVYGKAKVMSTPLGKVVRSIIEDGGAIGISSRGLGSVDENGYVNDTSFNLITWDVVGNPSNNPSWVNGIYEGKTWDVSDTGEILKENVIIETNQDELLKEDISNVEFTTIMTQLSEIKAHVENLKEQLSESIKGSIDEITEKFTEKLSKLELSLNEEELKKALTDIFSDVSKQEKVEPKEESKETPISEEDITKAQKLLFDHLKDLAFKALKS